MRAVLFTALIALAVGVAGAAERPREEMAAAQKIYTAKCAKCHKFYDPASYDTEQWNAWMQKMRRKARLDETQYTTLSRYLETVREHTPSQKD